MNVPAFLREPLDDEVETSASAGRAPSRWEGMAGVLGGERGDARSAAMEVMEV